MLHGEVSGRIVEGVVFQREIAGAYRHAAYGEVRTFVTGGEKLGHDRIVVIFGKLRQCSVGKLAKADAEALDGLADGIEVDDDVGLGAC